MKYALWDLQCHQYMHIGYGSKDLEDLKDALIDYISIDYQGGDEETVADWKTIQEMSAEDIAEMWDMRVEEGNFDYGKDDIG